MLYVECASCSPQVNQWLTWLETAEEEESEDEAD